MSDTALAVFSSWVINPEILAGLFVAGILYFRGWRVLHRVTPNRFPTWRLSAFLGGLAVLWLAIASPLDALSGLLLSAHMGQHLLLIAAGPPLILLGAPLLPILRGLPRGFARDGVGPFLRWPALRNIASFLTHPLTCWLAMAVTLCGWHFPAAFELALRSPAWHKVEHACFFAAALLFWWPVARPFPSRLHLPLLSLLLYLLSADMLNTGLSAILTFSDRVLYHPYAEAPRLFGTTALSDQAVAGLIMWVPGALVYLVPAFVLTVQFLSPRSSLTRPVAVTLKSPTLPKLYVETKIANKSDPFDVLAIPILGRFLRARSGRRFLQATLLVVAVAVIADGLFGPKLSSVNLAGVLPWTYWRALTVIGLLVAGNLFCMACPFMLPRELGRRLGLNHRSWPRAMRSKWFAVALLVVFFWAYEAFGLWNSPFLTAWLILGYFVIAFVIDAFFRGATFCKYICPIGQFHFVNSMVSPLEVKVRNPDVCASCKTHDCLRGNEHQRGCETDLYLPRKAGNMDCTFCLDCVRACPHDNVGVLATAPGTALLRDLQRPSIRRFSDRLDVAALALALVFAAFVGAAAMSVPIVSWRDDLADRLGLSSSGPLMLFLFMFALILFPSALMGIAVAAGRVASKVAVPVQQLFGRLSMALTPLGLTMWAAHFLFHLMPSWKSAWPVIQRALGDLGLHFAGNPDWTPAPLMGAGTLLHLQILLLDAGLLLTLYIGWRIARSCVASVRSSLELLAPWAGIVIGLYASGVWLVLQPMQMRGM